MTAFDMVAFIVLVAVIGGVLRAFIRSRSGAGPAGNRYPTVSDR